MTSLKERIVEQIRRSGPISLADYMEICLLDPISGYYNGDAPIGASGAFTTAPEISQMFGELIGLFLADAWLDQGSPPEIAIVELGPGRGTLLSDLLRAAAAVPSFAEAAEIVLVERSASSMKRQRKLLEQYRPRWTECVEDLPSKPLFVVANEFFDALPIRQFKREGGRWSERLVGEENGSLKFARSAPGTFGFLNGRLSDTRSGDVVEYRAKANEIARRIAKGISEFGGVALVLDYGGWSSVGDTFQATDSHEATDPLAEPGKADLTAHVDFGELARSFHGVSATSLITQGVFLERLGITDRARRLATSLAGEELESHIAAHRRLVHPDEMGNLFKVIAFHPAGAKLPAGFAE